MQQVTPQGTRVSLGNVPSISVVSRDSVSVLVSQPAVGLAEGAPRGVMIRACSVLYDEYHPWLFVGHNYSYLLK
jgi:hypothetical protein